MREKPTAQKESDMKKKPISKAEPLEMDEIPPMHDLDYSKAKPNRFASKLRKSAQVVVLLDPDVSQVFSTPESVNNILRALIANLPKTQLQKAGRR